MAHLGARTSEKKGGLWPYNFSIPRILVDETFGDMAQKPSSKTRRSEDQCDLWVNPDSNIRGREGSRGWDNRGNITAERGSRFLELADVALGLKKPVAKKKPASVVPHHRVEKTEPRGR